MIGQSRQAIFFSFLSKNYLFISSVLGDKKHIKKDQQQREQRGMLRINQRRNEVVGKENQSRSNRSISGQNNESSLTSSSRGMQNSAAPRFINLKTHSEAFWDILLRPLLNLRSLRPRTGQNLSRGVASKHQLVSFSLCDIPLHQTHFL